MPRKDVIYSVFKLHFFNLLQMHAIGKICLFKCDFLGCHYYFSVSFDVAFGDMCKFVIVPELLFIPINETELLVT